MFFNSCELSKFKCQRHVWQHYIDFGLFKFNFTGLLPAHVSVNMHTGGTIISNRCMFGVLKKKEEKKKLVRGEEFV